MKKQIKKVLEKYILPIIICILAISASIFISRALYNNDGKEIEAKIEANLDLVKQFNYEENQKEKSIIELNLKEKITYSEGYYSPVKEHSTYLKIPEINGKIPSSIEVICVSSKATNGQDEQKEAQFEYNPQTRNLHIYDNNEANDKAQYYSGSEKDYNEYEIILHYNEKIEITNDENSKITIPQLIRYESQNEEIGRIQSLINNEITLQESGNIVSSEINTQNIFNGYINSNISNETNYSTEFVQDTRIVVSKPISDEVILKEQNGFKTVENEYKETNQIIYKKIKINKQDLIRILGNEGTLQILDENENILMNISEDYNIDKKDIIFDFEGEVTGLTFKMSNPVNNGIIRIQEVKNISPDMKDLNNKYILTKHLIESKKFEYVSIKEKAIKNAITKINTSIDNIEWTSNMQNEIKITTTLITSKSDCNLFKNPTLEIELPSGVERVIIGDSYLLNANGLSIKDVNVVESQNGRKIIKANLEGSQTKYLFNNMIEGTNVVIPAIIILNKEITSYTDNINIKYTNNVGENVENGEKQIDIKLKAITEKKENEEIERDSAQNNPNKEEEINNKQQVHILSQTEEIKQNEALTINAVAEVGGKVVSQAGNEEITEDNIVYENQVIKYKVSITNNTNEVINNISVVGEIPNYTKYATLESGKHWDEKLGRYVYSFLDDVIYNYIEDETVKNYQFKDITTLQPGETLSEYYEVVIDRLEDDKQIEDILNNIDVTVNNEKYETYTLSNKLLKAKVAIKLKAQTDGTDKFVYRIDVENLAGVDLNNIHIETTEIPKELRFDSYSVIYTADSEHNGQIEDNKFKIDIPNIKANESQSIMMKFSGVNYEENKNQIELKMIASATVDETLYRSNENIINAYPQYVKAVMSLNEEGQEVRPGDVLTYKVTVKNESKVKTFTSIIGNLPKGLEGIEATYLSYEPKKQPTEEDAIVEVYDIEAEEKAEYDLVENKIDLSIKTEGRDDIYILTKIPANKTVTILIKAMVEEVDQNTEIANFITVSGPAIKTVVSNAIKVTAITNVKWDNISGGEDEDDKGDEEDNKGDNGDSDNKEEEQNPGNENTNPGNGNINTGNENTNTGNENTNTGNGNTNTGNGNTNSEDNSELNDRKKYSISGITWLDENEDGRRIENEKRLSGITVKLFNAETNSIVLVNNKKMILQVNDNGKYVFENIPTGRYYCLFEYNTLKYGITKYQAKDISPELNNDVSKAKVNIDGIVKEVGITDVLELNKDLKNIDLGLIENKIFDFKLEKNICKVIVTNSKGNKEYEYKDTSLAKVEISKKEIEKSIIKIEYNIKVTNEGNIGGYVNEVTDYIPKDLEFDKEKNSGWIVNKDGSLKNTTLTAKKLEPGESATLKLYLIKNMSNASTGITRNSAEITKSSNLKNLKDIDSISGNKVAEEDDYNSADIIISISTGIYRNTLILILIAGTIYIFIKVVRKYNKKLPTIMMMIMVTILIGTNISYGWQEDISFVGGDAEARRLSNGWWCAANGYHQCGRGTHIYECYEVASNVIKDEKNVLKEIELTKQNTTKNFKSLNSEYNIVGPYSVTCNYSIKSSTIQATVAGEGGYSVCDEMGNELTWTSGNSKTFYIKVPKTVTAVTSVTVEVTVADVIKISKIIEKTYNAYCIEVAGDHLNGSNEFVTVTPASCQTAEKKETVSIESTEDGIKSVKWGAVYSGSLQIRKYDADKKNDDGSAYELSKDCGALFTVKDSAGNIIATNVKPQTTLMGLVPDTYTIIETSAPNNYDLNLQKDTIKTAVVKADSENEPTTVVVKFYNQKYVDLELTKLDIDDKTPIEGMGFSIYDNAHKKYIKADGSQSDKEEIIYTDSNGKIEIKNIMLYDETQTFTIKEVASKNQYYEPDTSKVVTIKCENGKTTYKANVTIENRKSYVDLELIKVDSDDNSPIEGIGFTIYDNAHKKYIKADGSQSDKEEIIYTDSNGKIEIKHIRLYDEKQTFTIKEVASKNPYYKADTSKIETIKCENGKLTYKAKTTIENKKSYDITIEKNDPDKTDQKLTAYFYVQYEDGTWLTESQKYSNEPSSIQVTKSKKISGIKRGKYHIWEYKTPKGYDITQQDGYGTDKNHPTWVDCGIYYIGVDSSGNQDISVCSITVKKDNKKYIRNLTGFVWQENPKGKLNNIDNIFGDGDKKLSKIKVEFINKDGTILKSTTTGSDGSYSFTFKQEVLYWDLQNYMVRFNFDNKKYSTVQADLAVESRNASRALENHDWASDSLATGTGKATTIPNANSLEESIAKYYNENNYTIETINLGLLEKVGEEFSIVENLDYVELKKGSYTFKYEYGKEAVVQNVPQMSSIYDTVAFQNSARTFTQKIYPSDIAYNNTVSSNKFEVYVFYQITITNTMTLNVPEIYMEKTLNITSLSNEFNSEIYQINDNNWQSSGQGNAQYKQSISPIGPGQNVTIPIQFKVKDEGLQQLIQGAKSNPNIYKDCASMAVANGYHVFERYDYSWKYTPSPYKVKNQHRTKGTEQRSGALTLRLALAEQRAISGNVFEDLQTSESANNHTRIGNGVYDNNEKKVKAVEVSLLNKDDESVASLYNPEGEYLKQEGGIWKFTPQEATVNVNNDGTYSLKGVIPGKYCLRFTYNDGTQIIVDSGFNKIDLMNYKSTILTGEAVNNSQDMWYLNVMGGNNSIATDKYYIDENGNSSDVIKLRTESEKEMNHKSRKIFDKGKIQALSEAINIKFEYLKEESKDYDYNFQPVCSGMNFGIIERPHVDIQLEKSIKNVKLTLSNGTNLINGNPEDKNVSEYLTSINKSYAKVETEHTNLYGSSIEVTYKITVKNKSELDYASRNYYIFGTKDGGMQPVSTAVTKIVNYLSDKQGNYIEAGVAGEVIDISNNEYTNNEGYTKEDYYEDGIIEENKDYKDQILKTTNQYIMPENANLGNSEVDYTLTVSKLLPNIDQNENFGWDSYSEIIAITNITYTPQYINHSGSYIAGDQNPYPTGTSESDNDYAIISITPPTGKNRSYTIYIISAGILVIVAVGVIIIKKFVL